MNRITRTVTATIAAGLVTATAGVAGDAHAIVGGRTANITEAPWQVTLRMGGGHGCGGSIIDAYTVLTADHCVVGITPRKVVVRAGVTDHNDRRGQDRKVTQIIRHPDGIDGGADLAILKLASPLKFNKKVQPIAFASVADIDAATTGTATGWGQLSETEGGPRKLQLVEVPIYDDATCEILAEEEDAIIDERQVCGEGDGLGTCYGDSGGPLAVYTAEGPKLAGVVSFGFFECGEAPSVYAEVPYFADWINEYAG